MDLNFWQEFTQQHPECEKYQGKYKGSVIVLKAGGEVIESEFLDSFLYDTAMLRNLEAKPVLVYGAKKSINSALERAGIQDMGRVEGNRVTSEEMIQVIDDVQKEITGKIISFLRKYGAGAEEGFMYAKQWIPKSGEYAGFVGEPTDVDAKIRELMESGLIPVISFIGISHNGQKCNINADYVACVAAPQLEARSLLYLTDVEGVFDSQGKLMKELTGEDTEKMIESGIIKGGMMPKVTYALKAKGMGVEAVHIINGKQEHSVLLELLTDSGIGTMIR